MDCVVKNIYIVNIYLSGEKLGLTHGSTHISSFQAIYNEINRFFCGEIIAIRWKNIRYSSKYQKY